MANAAKPLNTHNRNYSKAQLAARQEAEKLVVTNPTVPKANENVKSFPRRILCNFFGK